MISLTLSPATGTLIPTEKVDTVLARDQRDPDVVDGVLALDWQGTLTEFVSRQFGRLARYFEGKHYHFYQSPVLAARLSLTEAACLAASKRGDREACT